jgi:hypothetical protein
MRARRQRAGRQEISPEAMAWARDEPSGIFPFIRNDDQLRQVWNLLRDEVVREHVADYPGTRPIRWWEFSSPEPRRRLGGTGTTWGDYHAQEHVPFRGLPGSSWFRAEDVARGTLSSAAVAVDASDPPLFESEAAYLRRLGLLIPGEARRLTAEDFEPHAIVIPPPPPPPTNGTFPGGGPAADRARALARAGR